MSRTFEFTLGIYGDGQLARLLILSAQKQNISALAYTLNENESPCKDLCPLHPGKNWTDKKSFTEFANRCEYIVLENEFVPAQFLLEAEQNGSKILPNAASFEKVSNKLKQVKLAESLEIKVPPYMLITDPEELLEVRLPAMLKSLSGGYDGYGNFTFSTLEQLKAAKEFIQTRGPSIAQEFIYFDQEVAVIIAGDGKNNFSFPVVETIQEKNICHFVLAPPRFSESLQNKIKNQAMKIIRVIGGKGVFGVEFFIRGQEVIFNEVAPRPHNSGHYSIEACDYSQFDALVKLIKNEPLTPPQLKVGAVGMLNLLGTQNGKALFKGDDAFQKDSQGFLHLYGKEDSRIGRKMGHFTLLGDDQEKLLKSLKELKLRYQI